jgi:hypothetical protein
MNVLLETLGRKNVREQKATGTGLSPTFEPITDRFQKVRKRSCDLQN